MKKEFVSTVLAYGIVTFALAAPWHFVFFKDMYHAFGIYNKPQPSFPLGILSMLLQGAVLACLYPRAYPNERSFKTGVHFCWLMGLFLFSVSTLANAAKIEVSPLTTWIGIQAAFHFIQFTLVGLALGVVYRGGEPALK